VLQILENANQDVADWGSNLIGFIGPTVLLTCLCSLLLTDHKLPVWRLSWINKVFARLRQHGVQDAEHGHAIAKKNQFAIGDTDFNLQAIWLIVIPQIIGVFAYLPQSMKWADEAATEEGINNKQLRWEYTSYLFGWASTLCLCWFLIPVTRHSILLVAMGWSPVHALRLHVWAGYLSFIYMILHGFILVVVWFVYYDYPVWQQIIPAQECWAWHPDNNEHTNDLHPPCDHVYFNWTGLLAAFFFMVLWATSLNWFRRRNYRLFYLIHVSFGTLMLLSTILHMKFFAIYLLPSSTYYLASTSPTLVQALASRFRGGVKIRKVVTVADSGGCMEVHVETNESANAELNKLPCMYVKLCVPKISIVWHPFTVYKHRSDPETVRFLFRPAGPFTKKLAECLASPTTRPVSLVDGFYRGADRCEQALQHDYVAVVAGGVAITPFLSMIPGLLSRLKSLSVSSTKSVVLHWVCREKGLSTFVVETYLKDMMAMARAVTGKDIKLRIKIHQTAKLKYPEPTEELWGEDTMVPQGEKFSTGSKDTSNSSTEIHQSGKNQHLDNAERSTSDELNDTKDGSVPSGSEDECPSKDESVLGHHMEVSHMMPGRFDYIQWNIPLFVAISVPSWITFWYIFQGYEWDETPSYHELAVLTWMSIYMVMIHIGFAILIKVAVWSLGKYLPEPKLDSFAVEEQVTVTKDCDPELEQNKNVTLEFYTGRPSMEEIFDPMKTAEAPGIFMCGPAPMIKDIRSEASKENSRFGLTRFCLYDEPFEM
jgi:predicted ferric reductase